MTQHISQEGYEVDDMDFLTVKCGCGVVIGPAPDTETMLDMAMEHAYNAAMKEWADASE
jgi:hypothetical protein